MIDNDLKLADLQDTLRHACSALLDYQAADGHFQGDLDQGVSSTAQTLILERFVGVLDSAEAAAAVRWMAAQIRRDGSIAAYPGTDVPSLAETCGVLGALAAAGVSEADPQRRRMQSFIDSRGGLRAVDPLTQAMLVMAGVLPASVLPDMPIEHVLIPGMARFIGGAFNAYFGLALSFMLPGLIHGLRAAASGETPGPVARAARLRIIDHLFSHQNPEGSWVGSQWATTMAIGCLFALGVPRSHDAIVRGLASLGRLKRRAPTAAGEGQFVIPIDGAIWNTAMALRVLTRAGVVGGGPDGEASRRAIEYLLANQSALPAPDDWTRVAAGAPRAGGWSFEPGNLLLSDTDTTAMVLTALADHAQAARVRSAMSRGQQWLLALQNDDGGFAAFTRNQRTAPPSALYGKAPPMPVTVSEKLRFFLHPPYEFVDIPSADLTGRVLSALGRLGLRRSNRVVDQAVRFIYGQRLGDVWWGRWTTNYLAATAFILPGLIAVGEDAAAPPVRRAVTWILAHQNDDGGFGESNQTYANPSLAGQGPSNAYVTGLVLQALCAVGQGHQAPAARAAGYLCKSQRADGLWEEFQALQLIAAEMFYKNFVNYQTAPIEALAIFRDLRFATSEPGVASAQQGVSS